MGAIIVGFSAKRQASNLLLLLLYSASMEGGKKTPEERFRELGFEFIPPKPSIGLYKAVVPYGNLVYTSGQVAVKQDHSVMTGKVGAEVDLAGGQAAARQCAITMLSALQVDPLHVYQLTL